MIQIQNLNYHYKKGKPIFTDISLNIKEGNIYGLLGENGVGKTTLLRIISGLLIPNKGTCQVFGYDAKKRLPQMLAVIYYLPEELSVPSISAIKYGKIYGDLYPNFDTEEYHRLLEQFSIDCKKVIDKQSFGQQKKTMIAFALACNTKFLLMDEPTNGLDIPSKSIFRQAIAETLNNDRTIIISTHQVRDLENLIDPIINLENNQILLNNTVSEITKKLKFSVQQEKSATALYQEQTLGGFFCVEQNNDETESNINIEALFNAALCNKEYFKNNMINNYHTEDIN
jgi:ABC-2 type transport system ATP-binding protein